MQSRLEESRKLKVLVAAPLPPPCGGIANWSRVIRAAFEKNEDTELAFVDTATRYRSPTNHAIGVRLIGGSAKSLRDICRIYWKMKKVHPHLLHLTTSAGPAALRDMIVLWLAKHLGVSRVIHYRMGRLPTVFARGGMESNLVRRTMRLADAVIILDDSSEKCLKDALPEVNVIRLPNMVEIDDMDRIGHAASPSKSASGAHPRIVFVGHVIPSKGLRELVLACVKLSACPIVLDIIGPVSDEFKQELLALASVTRQGNWITFLGQRDHDETVEHIARADIFVLPSYTEGMPNVVLEAMALGKPILATGVGAIPEMLDIGGEEECGVIVPPREVEPLAAGLERLMADPSLRLELGKKARQRVERLYSVPVACCQLNDAWESLLQSNKSE